jgi:hypothetical protein
MVQSATGRPSVPVTVRVTPEQAEALNARAALLGIRRSDLVRQALDLCLDPAVLGATVALALADQVPA